jgi:hypothetical protein
VRRSIGLSALRRRLMQLEDRASGKWRRAGAYRGFGKTSEEIDQELFEEIPQAIAQNAKRIDELRAQGEWVFDPTTATGIDIDAVVLAFEGEEMPAWLTEAVAARTAASSLPPLLDRHLHDELSRETLDRARLIYQQSS